MDKAVLIAGAGPVGLTMAMALKRLGVDVRIVDRAAGPSDRSKALVLWPRTLEQLDIHGCAQVFVDAGRKATGARIMARQDVLVHLRFDTVRSRYRHALMLAQSETERLLALQLATLGVEIEREVALVSFADGDDAVAAVLRHADGREETVRAAYLVGCDGAHSTVRHGLDLPFEGSTLPSDWLLADVRIAGSLPGDEITICWTPEGVLALFPIRGDRFRVVADVGLAAGESGPPVTLEDVQAVLDARGPAGLSAHAPNWLTRFRINERKVRDYRRGRIFLAGDAAHIHSPAGGQGMNTGMQDAFNLAWKLAMVWHADASPRLLESYSPERSAIGDEVLRNAGAMTKVSLIRHPILQEIRGLAADVLGRIPALRRRMVDQLTEIDLHYADGPLTATPPGAARHPAGGARAPDIALVATEGGPARLHELLSAGTFAVLSVGAPRIELPADLRAVATSAVAATAAGEDGEDDYDPGHVYLIRPDAYVASSTRGGDGGSILAWLNRLKSGE